MKQIGILKKEQSDIWKHLVVCSVSCVCSEKITNFTTNWSPRDGTFTAIIKNSIGLGNNSLEVITMKIFLAILLFVSLNYSFGKQEGEAWQFVHSILDMKRISDPFSFWMILTTPFKIEIKLNQQRKVAERFNPVQKKKNLKSIWFLKAVYLRPLKFPFFKTRNID